MNSLRNIRFYVLLFAVLLSIAVFYQTVTGIGYEEGVPSLVRSYALLTIVFLYLALLIGSATFALRSFPHRAQLIISIRALSVASFYYALLHTLLVIVKTSDGYAEQFAPQSNVLLSTLFGLAALLIFSLLAIASTDRIVHRISARQRTLLGRLFYIVGVLSLLHAYFLRSALFDPASRLMRVFTAAMIVFLALEAWRMMSIARTKFIGRSQESDPDVLSPASLVFPSALEGAVETVSDDESDGDASSTRTE
jgi:DMSO/TMAO reductase YedYZ heme-binding membrane subunit